MPAAMHPLPCTAVPLPPLRRAQTLHCIHLTPMVLTPNYMLSPFDLR